jgi:hypothetical protein
MSPMEPVPAVTQIMDDGALAFALRFDQPVNHVRSILTLLTPDGIRMLPVRLSAQPNTLYSAIGQLTPGLYGLRWQARTPTDETLPGRFRSPSLVEEAGEPTGGNLAIVAAD